MSGWYYMKEGMLDDSEIGPLTDQAFLQMAFDGSLNLKSKIRHEKHTRNNWAFLEQIPAAKKKVEEGERSRAEKAAAEKAAKQEQKRQVILAKEEERQRAAEQRHWAEQERQAEQQRMMATGDQQDRPMHGQVMPHPPQPIAVMVHTHNPAYQQLQATGWFTRAFGSTMGIMTAIAAVMVGIPVLLCGGCLALSVMVAKTTPPTTEQSAAPAPQDLATMVGKPAMIGPIRISVQSAAVGPVPLESFGDAGQSENPQLQVILKLDNTDSAKKVTYSGWGAGSFGISFHAATLTDDVGNSYNRITFGISKIIGQHDGTSIYPARSITDKLVFEPPTSGAKYLVLNLPAAALDSGGKDGRLVFRSPH